MIKAVLIEDEKNSRLVLKSILQAECPNVQILGEAGSVEEGRTLIETRNPDLVFLDVQMPDGTGFDVIAAFPDPKFKVIFVTAYSQYAIKAFKYSAIDYVLKPIERSELVAAVNKIEEIESKDQYSEKVNTLVQNRKSFERIALTTTEGIIFAKVKEIIRCEAESNYTTLFLDDGRKLVVSKTLKDMDEMLSSSGFYRVHKSHLVNLEHVDQFINAEGGYVQMADKSKVEVARRRKEEFLDILMSYHKD